MHKPHAKSSLPDLALARKSEHVSVAKESARPVDRIRICTAFPEAKTGFHPLMRYASVYENRASCSIEP